MLPQLLRRLCELGGVNVRLLLLLLCDVAVVVVVDDLAGRMFLGDALNPDRPSHTNGLLLG